MTPIKFNTSIYEKDLDMEIHELMSFLRDEIEEGEEFDVEVTATLYKGCKSYDYYTPDEHPYVEDLTIFYNNIDITEICENVVEAIEEECWNYLPCKEDLY